MINFAPIKAPALTPEQFSEELQSLLQRLNPAAEPVSYSASNLDEHDLLLTFDIRLQSRDGEVVRSRGHSVLNHIMSPQGLPEAPDILQAAHYTNIWKPLRGKLLAFLQSRLTNQRRLPLAEGSMSDYDPTNSPAIPAFTDYSGTGPTALSDE
jgi:hypothetical protein